MYPELTSSTSSRVTEKGVRSSPKGFHADRDALQQSRCFASAARGAAAGLDLGRVFAESARALTQDRDGDGEIDVYGVASRRGGGGTLSR